MESELGLLCVLGRNMLSNGVNREREREQYPTSLCIGLQPSAVHKGVPIAENKYHSSVYKSRCWTEMEYFGMWHLIVLPELNENFVNFVGTALLVYRRLFTDKVLCRNGTF